MVSEGQPPNRRAHPANEGSKRARSQRRRHLLTRVREQLKADGPFDLLALFPHLPGSGAEGYRKGGERYVKVPSPR